MKNCKYCGAELADGASWCPECEQEQNEIICIKGKRPLRRLASLICLCCIAALLLAGFSYQRHKPQTFEGGAHLTYSINGENYDVIASFSPPSKGRTGEEETSVKAVDGDIAAMMARLYIMKENESGAAEEFIDHIESCSVTAVPRDGAEALQVNGPYRGKEIGSDAAYLADLLYEVKCGTNDIYWQIEMKNKDVLKLHQSLTCEELEIMDIHYEDTPMESADQVREVVHRIYEDEDPDLVLNLYLPPTVYEDDLVIDERAVNLIGTDDGENRTIFKGTIWIKAREPHLADINNIVFEGSGDAGIREGIGIISDTSAIVSDCTFRNLKTGVDMRQGSWVYMENSLFENNDTGFIFDSEKATSSSGAFPGLTFINNEVGAKIVHIPGNLKVALEGVVFEGNKTDLIDPDGLIILPD